MNPNDLEKMPLRVESLFFEMQNRIMEDVVRRIKKTGEITSTADYQIEKLQMFGNSSEFIESEIKRVSNLTDAEIWKLYDEAAYKEYTRNKSLYEQVNANFIPYEENEVLQSWTNAIIEQTRNDIKNITASMGFAINLMGKTVFTPFSEYYQKYLDRACMDVVTGVFDYNTVIRRTVKEMTASGIRTIDYASGYSSRVTVASRRAVLTGVNQLSAQINEDNAKKLGTNTFEVTYHSGARPSHWWGGMVFTKEELENVCGLGRVDGLCGANCRHNYMAFIPGISTRTYTDEQLQTMRLKEQATKEWQGKKYNAYDATVKQRDMERLMQRQRSNIKLLKSGKASDDDILAAQAKYLNTLHNYQGFSKKMGIEPQMSRVYVDGLGKMVGATIPNMKRKERNVNPFDSLQIPMQKRAITRISNKYKLKIDDLDIKIQRNEELINLFYYGSTDYDDIGRIDLFPKAFNSEEELVRTIIHERCHVLQLRKYGKEYAQENINIMEKEAYKFEDFWYNMIIRRANR